MKVGTLHSCNVTARWCTAQLNYDFKSERGSRGMAAHVGPYNLNRAAPIRLPASCLRHSLAGIRLGAAERSTARSCVP